MVLELRNIEKSFGAKKVLKGISLRAEGGKAFGLLGRNGAGKTTSIRILMDVFSADSGEVLMDGKAVDYSKIRIGYLPEERGLYPKKQIFDQLVYFTRLKGIEKKKAEASVEYWLKRLGMIDEKNKRLDTLSKGNQQKIQLVTALAHDPDIVILDEPFSGLDPVNARLLKDVVKELISNGKIVLLSSHQMSYIEEFCDTIAIIKDGTVAVSGDIRELKRNYVRDKLVINTTEPGAIVSAFGDRATVTNKGDVLLRLDSADDKKAVMRQLVDGFDVDGVSVFEPSLNDIFVEFASDAGEEE